jgi:hypothetical protein
MDENALPGCQPLASNKQSLVEDCQPAASSQ